jgi:hypothetical protein
MTSFSVAIGLVVVIGWMNGSQSVRAQSGTGGFMASATDTGLRPRLSTAQIQTFMPSRGQFTFPAPYNTQAARITNGSDCGGQDCVHPVGYSYWANMNNHAGSNRILIFLGLERRTGGGGPTLFSYDKNTGDVQNMGPLFSPDDEHSWDTGEGWYFSATQPNILYVNHVTSPLLQRYDVISHALTTVFDVTSRPDIFGSNRYIWQFHSSNDDRVHSATLKDASNYADLGCFAYREDTNQFFYYPQKGLQYDECQIDKSGRWLVIKEKTGLDPKSEVDDRIIDLQTGNERDLLDVNGAGGHSDNGYGVMLAADNYNPQPGAVRLWDFNLDMHGGEPVASVPGQGLLVSQTTNWAADVGHVSFVNARSDIPISQQYACSSQASRQDLPRANELLCWRLDGSLQTLVVAPNITDLNASGGGTDDYWKLPKANVDFSGQYMIWTANSGTSRLDAYVVRIPTDKLGGSAPPPAPTPSPTPAPTPTPTPTPTPSPSPTPTPTPTPSPTPTPAATSGQAVTWTNLANVSASGNSLTKSGGCGGCADAGANSQQAIASGTGYLQFTVSETDTLRLIGFSTGSTGTSPNIAAALRLQAGRAEVREAGVYRSETAVATGDVLTITAGGGSVKYSKNGTVFYTSAIQPAYPLVVNTALLDLGSTIRNVTIGSASATGSSTAGTAASTSKTNATRPTSHIGLRNFRKK